MNLGHSYLCVDIASQLVNTQMEFTIVPALWWFTQLTNMNSKTAAIDQDMEWRFLLVFVERDFA